jgi:uncharacterized protein (DUF1800 family)
MQAELHRRLVQSVPLAAVVEQVMSLVVHSPEDLAAVQRLLLV